MRGGVAAQRQQLAPAAPDTDEQHAAALAETRALIRELRGNPGCERTVLELIELEMRLAELRDARDRYMRQEAIEGHLIELGRRMERTEQAARRPAPRHRQPLTSSQTRCS